MHSFGNAGQSRRGIDIGWTKERGPFSSTHFSRWNYSIPAMRYDVFEHRLTDDLYTESNNLFDFGAKMMYSWDQHQNCTKCPQPKLLKECIPETWLVQDVIYVAGQKIQVYVDDMENKRNSQSATAASIGPTPWLVNILSYDQYQNVVEAVQIQDFLQGVVEDPTALQVPPFCADAPQCASMEQHLQTSVAGVLPEYLQRRFGWK